MSSGAGVTSEYCSLCHANTERRLAKMENRQELMDDKINKTVTAISRKLNGALIGLVLTLLTVIVRAL